MSEADPASSRPVAWRDLPGEPEFRRGILAMAPTALGISAWGLVTGVAMAKSGMGTAMAIFMALVAYAGSAQLAVLPLLAAGSPIWVIWLTATCVNLRFVIFSTLWRRYFGLLPLKRRCTIGYFSGDVTFVVFQQRFPEQRPGPGREAFFWGASMTNWLAWQVPCVTGIFLADVIPVSWGLGFAGVVALLAMACSMLQGRIQAMSAVVAAGAAVAAYALPLKLNILVGIAAAVAMGLVAETLFPPRSRVVQRTDVTPSPKEPRP